MRKSFPGINNHFWVCLSLMVFTTTFLSAQDWQSIYNQALEKYQSEDYSNSISLAESAYEKAKSLTPLNQAYSIQLITSNCVAMGNAEKGLKYIDNEINLFQQVGGTNNKSLAEAMKKQILFLQQKGQIKSAIEKSNSVLKCFTANYGADDTQTILFTALTGDLALANGDSLIAKKTWNDCLTSMAGKQDAKEDYKLLLYNSAALDENLKDYSSAIKKYGDLISFLEKDGQKEDPLNEESKKALLRLKDGAPPTIIVSSPLEQQLKKAILFQSQNQLQNALNAYNEASDLADKNGTKDKTTFSVYFNYARILLDDGDIKMADQFLQKAKSLSAILFKPTDSENLLIQLSSADLLLALGQSGKAVEQYQLLLTLFSKEIQSSIAKSILASSNQLLTNGMPRLTEKLLRPFLCCLSEKGSSVTGTSLSISLTYCDALLSLNQPDSVMQFLSQPIFGNQLSIELKKAEALQEKGQWTQAMEKLKSAEATIGLTDRSRGDVNYNIARLAQKMGDYVKAESYYQKAQGNYSKVSSEDVWQTSNSLATLYSKLGNYDKSEKMIKELLAQVPQKHPLHNTLSENLAANYIETNQVEKAKAIQEAIVENEKQTLGENHPDYALAISNLAVLYQKEGKYQIAKDLLQKALLITKNNFGDQNIDYGLKESNLGAVLKDFGDLNNALNSLVHAEKILSDKLGKNHPDYVSCEYNLAMVLKRTGQPLQSLPFLQHLSEFYKKQVHDIFPAMSEQEQMAFYNKINKAVQDYQQFAIEIAPTRPELIGQLFDFRLATKALLLNSSTKIRERILSGNDQKLKDQFLSWLSLKEELGKLYNTKRDGYIVNKISQLEAQSDEIEKQISSASIMFKKDKDERAVTWKNIKSYLKPGEAAIEFVRVKASGKTDSISYAALILKNDNIEPTLVVFSNGKGMETREFNFYKNTMVSLIKNDRSYRVFWQAVEPGLKGIEKIYFSADGIYNKINLSTLRDPVKNEFLNNRYKFILVSSLRDLAINNTKTEEKTKTAQLFGPINFGGGASGIKTPIRSSISGRIFSLPGSRTEIEKIDQVLKNAQWSSLLQIEGKASEKNIKDIQSPTLLHIATHGFFIPQDDIENEKSEVIENPLLKSGLILSEISNSSGSTEDGFLTAYEVKNLNFDKTDLVVLSACETGSGEVRNGEGVYGLQRAFLIGGARNILMSLWKVNDQATQELMILFYQKFLAGQNKSDALRAAQSELQKKYPDPYYWGGFVLIGNPN